MSGFRRLRVGVFLPRQPQRVGGGFTFEHTIFNEILARVSRDEQYCSIQYIPIANSIDECVAWGVDPRLCLTTDSHSSSRAPAYKKVYKRLIQKFKSPDYLSVQRQKQLDSLVHASVDACWSLSPSIPSIRVPYIITVWDLQHRLQPFFPEVSSVGGWSWQAREAHYSTVAAQAFACVVGTRRGRAELMRFFGVDPSRIIVNPFPCPPPIGQHESIQSDILRKLGLTSSQFLLYPAQFWSHKNHLCALYALKILAARHLALKIVFTGSDYGCFKAVEQKAKELGVDAHVIMPGFVSRVELAHLYRACSLLIYPSFFGPDNIPPLEAMSYGVPALVASVPGANEQYGEAALFFNPEKPDQLAEMVIKLVENNELRNSIRSKGFDMIAGLTPSNYVDRVESFLLSSRLALECCSL